MNIFDELPSNSRAYEEHALIAKTGFREYDARWLLGSQINLNGFVLLGEALGTQLPLLDAPKEIIVGHDFRSYSQAVKNALIIGLMNTGCRVHDIGLCTSPMAYFAQFHLDVQSVAMVTASHNENGWTGVKIGTKRPLTHGPEEMSQLKDITLQKKMDPIGGGSLVRHHHIADAYLEDLLSMGRVTKKLKVVCAAGNGTAGAFAPKLFQDLGCEVIEETCELDHSFPNYNPNPEDMVMLHALSEKVRAHGADVGFAFDGDGDRCGVVDNEGEEIFADKMGVIMAREFARHHTAPLFVVDVKSTSLFNTDDMLRNLGARTEYWKTGHSYMKRHVNERGALAGFEKSGHYFLNPPLGRGYDDGLLTAVHICHMLCAQSPQSLADLRRSLPMTWSSPTMSPYCADEKKYAVVEQIADGFEEDAAAGLLVNGLKIKDINRVNGIRITLEDGTWGLVRASSNKPNLVVVVESPVSEERMKGIFKVIDQRLECIDDVGAYDQKIELD